MGQSSAAVSVTGGRLGANSFAFQKSFVFFQIFIMSAISFDSYCAEHPDIFKVDHLFVHADLSNLRHLLKKYGVAVVPSCLSPEECEESLEHIHRFYENLTKHMEPPYRHQDPNTFRTLTQGSVCKKHGMLFQGYGVGQCQGSWNVRQHPKVYEAFAALWREDDLLTSMDGMAYQVPPEFIPQSRADYLRFKKTWYHTDQNLSRNRFECVQGQVCLHDVTPGDATLMVLEGSHRHHGDFAATFEIPKDKNDWFLLERKGADKNAFVDFYLSRGCVERRISCPRGSLILWDSRTIHCGSEPLRGRPNAHWRTVVYVCMTPRRLCDAKNMEKRKKAFVDMDTTSHWPHRVNIFPTFEAGRFTTHHTGINLRDQTYPFLSDLGKALLLGRDGVDAFPELPTRRVYVPLLNERGRPLSKTAQAAAVAALDDSVKKL